MRVDFTREDNEVKKMLRIYVVMMLATVLLCGCGGSSVPGTGAEVDKSADSSTTDVQSSTDDKNTEGAADVVVEDDNESAESTDEKEAEKEDSSVEAADSEDQETDDALTDETEVAALDEAAEEDVASDNSEEEVQDNKKDKKDKKEKKEKSGTSVIDVTTWVGQDFEKIKPDLKLTVDPLSALFGITAENATSFTVGDDGGANISYSKETGLVDHASAYSDLYSAAGAQCGMSMDEVKKIYEKAGFELLGGAYFDGDYDEAQVYSNGKVVIEVGPGEDGVGRLDVYQYDDYDLSWFEE